MRRSHVACAIRAVSHSRGSETWLMLRGAPWLAAGADPPSLDWMRKMIVTKLGSEASRPAVLDFTSPRPIMASFLAVSRFSNIFPILLPAFWRHCRSLVGCAPNTVQYASECTIVQCLSLSECIGTKILLNCPGVHAALRLLTADYARSQIRDPRR